MYFISSLSQESKEFFNFLNYGGRALDLRTSISIAKAIAQSLVLPTSEVDDLSNYYKMTIAIEAAQRLNGLNELLAVDTDTILVYIEKFYALRYKTLFSKAKIVCLSKEKLIQDFFGISEFIDENAIQVLSEDPIITTKVYNGVVALLVDLFKKEELNPEIKE